MRRWGTKLENKAEVEGAAKIDMQKQHVNMRSSFKTEDSEEEIT